ncbi:NAD-dependent epimerase/dehydratase family protein, partial [Ralstonia pseudosolanacearum]
MKLLITGATGYIGQRLVTAALAGGHEVVAAG